MAEYFPGTIYIGGALPLDRLDDLIAAAEDDGVTAADGSDIGSESELRSSIEGTVPLVLMDDDASFGELPALEAACQELGLTFRRESDARYEYEAEIVSWAPGMDEPRRTAGSQDGTAMVAIDIVRGILDAPRASAAEVVARLRNEIARHTPVHVPPLVLVPPRPDAAAPRADA